MKKTAIIYGTRPEFLKVFPIILEAQKRKLNFIAINTGQHSNLLTDLENLFEFKPNYNLNVQNTKYSNSELLAQIITRISNVLKKENFTHIIAQGDTLSVLGASITGFLEKLPFYHIEAGLRTTNINEPFPEEFNRRSTTIATKLHFAPTLRSKNNLLKEGINENDIYVTGNTIIDMLSHVIERENIEIKKNNLVIITAHRRENIGQNLENIGIAIKDLATENKNITFKWILHPNPNVRNQIKCILKDHPNNIEFLEPLNYIDNLKLMANANLIITDSGGIQEEAPSLNKKVLILRDETERPEVIECNCGILVGSNIDKIKNTFNNEINKQSDFLAINPFGNGDAAKKILSIIEND
ncbi:non-hydrolyzing UDP-N-acetylglucosamine 2-epimerase [Chryseobacterium taihuense]|uniref:UDP-N-acetylglucosamine 2-epimerase (non-hydrolyzing) n=1 Tax=Chryseobacterium taihuense TaxID=1141221 RepID=A0ABY0QTM4_9FLAO|nr:UDP-N-acetylglucosamine 2-epimerase (non-hydrolyzing) [Chryseobacterium taihuense]SDL86381.1 UDP-N-acetylglucosamine 2-epimerase (non-hydrolysing) [Chryseobacterium taihuense]